MKYIWEDLPERKHCFTVKNTEMINLNTGKVVRHYSTNVKIVVVQKCVTPKKTYYRTADAAHHYLNYAFEASAFGLPNEKAPLEPSSHNSSSKKSDLKSARHAVKPKKKQKVSQKKTLSKSGEGERMNWFRKLFRRKNG